MREVLSARLNLQYQLVPPAEEECAAAAAVVWSRAAAALDFFRPCSHLGLEYLSLRIVKPGRL